MNGKYLKFSALTFSAVALAAQSLSVEAFQSSQGYTGLLFIPNAQVQGRYAWDVQINDAVHEEARPRADRAQNIAVSIGLLPRVELSGRIYTAYAPNDRRLDNDLSASAKAQLWHSEQVSLAVGYADFAGEAVKLSSRYVVADYAPIKQIRMTVGFSDGPDRLDGAFGGLEVRPFHFVGLLGEYDSNEVNAGLRLYAPEWKGVTAYLGAATQRDARESVQLAAGLSFNFGRPNPPGNPPYIVQGEGQLSRAHQQISADLPIDAAMPLARVDSSQWGHNANDAFYDQCKDGKTASHRFSETRYGIPLRTARVDCVDGVAQVQTASWQSQRLTDFDLTKAQNWEDTLLSFRVEPALVNNVATEFGVYDYSLGVQTSARLQLPAGLAIYHVHEDPVTESDDFEDGGVFAGGRIRSRSVETMMQWLAHPLPGLITGVAAGKKRIAGVDTEAVMAEVLLHSPSGAHQVSAAGGKFSPDDDVDIGEEDYYRLTYRYLWARQDVAFALSHGCYMLAGDCGQTYVLERYMKGLNFFVFFSVAGADDQVGGIGFQAPLTFRKAPQYKHVRLDGTPAFSYALQTTVNPEDGRNVLRPGFMFEPRLKYDPRRIILDRNKAFPGYFH